MRISDWSSDVCSSDLLILYRLLFPYIFIGQRCQYVDTILVRAARFRVPERADFIDRCTMVIIVPDRSDLHSPVLQISPTTSSKARSTAFIRSSSSRPKGSLIFERGRVESLSTITCESTRNPLALSGSTVMRKAASRTALVIGQITTLSRAARRFDCTMRAGRGLP